MREQGPPAPHGEARREQRGVVIRLFELDRDGTLRIPASDAHGRHATREQCMRAHPSSKPRPLHLV
ncbi:MAG TPA: hypothetical protein VMU75_05410 [Acidimicrobiales bacterium]|nr:hypothetical protein [Acidimicrobiales bacterium]